MNCSNFESEVFRAFFLLFLFELDACDDKFSDPQSVVVHVKLDKAARKDGSALLHFRKRYVVVAGFNSLRS